MCFWISKVLSRQLIITKFKQQIRCASPVCSFFSIQIDKIGKPQSFLSPSNVSLISKARKNAYKNFYTKYMLKVRRWYKGQVFNLIHQQLWRERAFTHFKLRALHRRRKAFVLRWSKRRGGVRRIYTRYARALWNYKKWLNRSLRSCSYHYHRFLSQYYLRLGHHQRWFKRVWLFKFLNKEDSKTRLRVKSVSYRNWRTGQSSSTKEKLSLHPQNTDYSRKRRPRRIPNFHELVRSIKNVVLPPSLLLARSYPRSIRFHKVVGPRLLRYFQSRYFVRQRRSVARVRHTVPSFMFIAPKKNNVFITFTDGLGRSLQYWTAKTLGYQHRDKRPYFVLKETIYAALRGFSATSRGRQVRLITVFQRTANFSKARAMLKHALRCFKMLWIDRLLLGAPYAHAGTKFASRRRRRNKRRNRFIKKALTDETLSYFRSSRYSRLWRWFPAGRYQHL